MKMIMRAAALLLLAWALATQAYACDVCGSFSLGLNPNYNRNQVGFRYRYRSYLGHHSHGTGDTGLSHGDMDKEVTQTGELFLRLYPNPKWQLLAVVPVAYNAGYNHHALAKDALGLGDPSVFAYRQLWQHKPAEDNGWGNRMFAGGGLTMPLGRKLVTDGDFDPTFSPGSGAWALQAGAMWIVTKGKLTLGLDATSRYSLANSFGYQYGWRNSANANAFYRIDLGEKVSLLPNLGLATEVDSYDWDGGLRNDDSGGWLALGSGGVDVYAGRFSMSMQAQHAVAKVLNGSQAQPAMRLNGGLFYSF